MTPTPTSGRRGRRTPKHEPRTLWQLRANDRSTIRTAVSNLMRSTKWGRMAPKDREAAVRKAIAAKLEERDLDDGTRTVKKEYPEDYDEEFEIQYFLEYYQVEIGQATEQDDDEVLPGHRRVKREVDYDEDKEDEEEESEATDENVEDKNMVEEYDNGDNEANEPSGFQVVSRGLVITTNGPNLRSYNAKAKARSDSKASNGLLSSRTGLCGITKDQKWNRAKRSWRWVNGRMFVWPEIDAVLQASEFS